ncbi:MAG TPA: SLC13 family permease [Candidatus Thermoplasmatota archaeon]|nr:SLC13 family permease [Candidatus Thermoplasmatota archaeon]
MTWTPILALVVFGGTLAALTFPSLPRLGRRAAERAFGPARVARVTFLFARPGLAVAGAGLMLLAGAVAPGAAVAAVDRPTLALLFGMMALVAGLEVAGFFGWTAAAIVRRVRTARGFLLATMALAAGLSALALNDAVVLLLTPVLVRACRAMDLPCFPFLAAEAVAANIGSLATPVGNPQNAAIALASGMSFARFVAVLAPAALVALVLAALVALVWFRRVLARPVRRVEPAFEPLDRPLLALALGVLALVLAGFVVAPAGFTLGDVALAGGLLLLVAAWAGARVPPARLLARVDWGILALFIGLFVLMAGFRDAGLLAGFEGALAAMRPDTVPGLAVVTAVLSNLVSNVPAVLLLAPTAAAQGGDLPWLVLATASTLAGNATLVGAAANLIVAEAARGRGEDVDALRFLAFGLPVTLVTLAAALAVVLALA